MNVRVAFALKANYGSDREVASQCLANDLESGLNYLYIVDSEDAETLVIENSTKIQIKSFKIDRFLKWIPRGTRYQIWLQYVQLWIFINRKSLKTISFITLTQLICPIWTQLFIPTVVGPLGTIGLVKGNHSYKLLLKSFFIWRVLRIIPLLFLRGRNLTVAVIHPSLICFIPRQTNVRIVSALDPKYLKNHVDIHSEKERIVVSVGRDVSFKNFGLVRAVFRQLSLKNDNKFKFILINSTLGCDVLQHTSMFQEVGRLPREEVLSLMSRASLHLMPSFELAGFVSLEAAMKKTATFCIKDMGAHHMLSPSNEFMLSGMSLTSKRLEERIAMLLDDPKLRKAEGNRQYNNARLFIEKNEKSLNNLRSHDF